MGYIKDMMSSNNGVSSKRIITTAAAMLVFLVVIVDLFTDKKITDYVFEGLIFMAMAGLGSITLERFANRNNPVKSSSSSNMKCNCNQNEVG